MSERKGLIVLLGLYVFFAFGYSVLMPIWEAPDEAWHYHFALTLLKEGQPPAPEENIEASQPVLYYWGASRVLRVLEALKPSWVEYYAPKERIFEPERAIYRWSPETYRVMVGAQVLRWVNVMMGGLTVWCIYQGAKAFTGGDVHLALAGAALAALTPQFVHISSSVTNDGLGNLAGAGMFWLTGVLCTQAVRGRWLAMGVLVGLFLPLITKLTALPMGLTLFIVSAWQGRKFWLNQEFWRDWGKRLLGAGIGFGGLMVLGLGLFAPQVLRNIWAEIVWRGFTVRPNLGDAPLTDVLWAFTVSYWGKVGWLSTGLNPSTSRLLTQVVLFGWAMTFRLFYRPTERFRWGVVWLAVGLAFLLVVKNTLTTPQYQGRFFFPEIGPIALLAVAGWANVLRKWTKPYFWVILVLVMSGLNFWLWSAKIIPVYFQPFFDR